MKSSEKSKDHNTTDRCDFCFAQTGQRLPRFAGVKIRHCITMFCVISAWLQFGCSEMTSEDKSVSEMMILLHYDMMATDENVDGAFLYIEGAVPMHDVALDNNWTEVVEPPIFLTSTRVGVGPLHGGEDGHGLEMFHMDCTDGRVIIYDHVDSEDGQALPIRSRYQCVSIRQAAKNLVERQKERVRSGHRCGGQGDDKVCWVNGVYCPPEDTMPDGESCTPPYETARDCYAGESGSDGFPEFCEAMYNGDLGETKSLDRLENCSVNVLGVATGEFFGCLGVGGIVKAFTPGPFSAIGATIGCLAVSAGVNILYAYHVVSTCWDPNSEIVGDVPVNQTHVFEGSNGGNNNSISHLDTTIIDHDYHNEYSYNVHDLHGYEFDIITRHEYDEREVAIGVIVEADCNSHFSDIFGGEDRSEIGTVEIAIPFDSSNSLDTSNLNVLGVDMAVVDEVSEQISELFGSGPCTWGCSIPDEQKTEVNDIGISITQYRQTDMAECVSIPGGRYRNGGFLCATQTLGLSFRSDSEVCATSTPFLYGTQLCYDQTQGLRFDFHFDGDDSWADNGRIDYGDGYLSVSAVDCHAHTNYIMPWEEVSGLTNLPQDLVDDFEFTWPENAISGRDHPVGMQAMHHFGVTYLVLKGKENGNKDGWIALTAFNDRGQYLNHHNVYRDCGSAHRFSVDGECSEQTLEINLICAAPAMIPESDWPL